MDQENGKRLFKTPKELGVDILDEQGKVVNHVDYGTNGITGLNLQDVYEYTSPEGEKTYYSKETDIPSGIYLDADTGRIKIQVPEKWKDDERVKSWADSSTLKLISGNYRNNKDVKYPHPYDETKKITTQEYVDYLNNGLKSRIAALEAETPTKMNLIQYFGGDDKKNAAIDSLSAEDVITMSLSYDKDDSWVPLPKYMLAAYPQLKKLSTYKNGFVQKKDFLDNFYNIESGAITERYAHGIATAPQKVLEKIEDLDADEIAKTVGFSRFISQVDPKRSPISQFLQAGDALARGFYGSLTDWTKDTAELIGNIATFSWATGEKADASEFMGGLLFGENGFLTPSSTEALAPAMQQMAATNKDALTKAQAGLVQGAIAGKALDMVISTAAINKVANIASNAITNAITSAGGRALGNAMTATRAAEYTTEGLATVSSATGMASTAGTVAANQAIFAKAASGSAAYTTFFGQTLSSALYTYSKNIGGMTTYFRAMPTAQFATIVNSAAKIANAATYANTAVGVLGSMVFAAIVNNKELTNKVLSGEATSDEAKDLLRQTLFDTAKVQAASWMLGLNPKIAGLENKLSDKLESINQAMSQFFTGLGAKAASPWIRFMQWLVNNKAAAAAAGGAKLSNAAVARAEALKEVVLLNEAKQYATNLSRVAGTNAPRLLEEALASAGIDIGTSMADTLKKLEEVGYNFDPADLAMSEFEGWQGSMAELRNVLTTWGDINTNVSKVVLEFTNPDIQPTISQQMSEINKADTDLIKAEKEAGLLDAKTYKTDIKLSKQNEGYIYSAHSEELSRYIVRKYEMGVIANEARANGITDLDNYQPYVEARARYTAAAELVPENIRNIADTKYLPALKKAEHEIINVMMDDGVYPRSFVEAMRAGGKFGTDGNDWIRLVARKDLPKGTYNPYSKTVKRDNTIALGSFNVLEDGDITWPGNGLQELITEYGVARSEKAFLDASKRATGLVTDVKIPGRKTAAAGRIEEFKTDFEKAVKQGFKSFTEEVEGTAAVGNKRANQQREFYNEVAKLGGVQAVDIDELRSVMHDKGVTTADSIVDQASLDKYLDISSKEARDLLLKYVGDKLDDLTLQGPKMSDIEREEFNNLEKALNANVVLRDAAALEKSMLVRYTRGAENKSTSGHGYHDLYLNTEKRVANGEIAEEDRLKDFAEQLQNDISNGLKASQYLAYRALIKRDFSDPSIFENIPHPQLRKKINRYIELNEKAKAENQGLTADNWGEFWKNATPNVRKILRGELERTANATGYGIKDTRARLNALVPGFDVLDWSLLGPEHVNGLVEGGMYAGMENNQVNAYIMDLDDLRKITGLNKNTDDLSQSAIDKIRKDINTEGGEAVIPIHFGTVSGEEKFYPQIRWGNSGDKFPDWETYFNYLQSKGITKVPVAIVNEDLKNVIDTLRDSGIAQRGLDNIVAEIDRSVATGENPNFNVRDISAALHLPGVTRNYIRNNRIHRNISKTPSDDGVAYITDDELDKLFDAADSYDWSKDEEFLSHNDVIKNKVRDAIGKDAKDITEDVKKAFSEYGQIPIYHGQHAPLGSIEPNDVDQFPTTREGQLYGNHAAGDALWLAPNASYTDEYGRNKTASMIPVKSMLTDKAKAELMDKMINRLSELQDKIEEGFKKLADKDQSIADLRNEYPYDFVDLVKWESYGTPQDKEMVELAKKMLTKKELADYEKYAKIIDMSMVSGNGISEHGRHVIRSYRALAELTGKPIIDITKDGWANGTAYFYYKGIDPEFDKTLGETLQTQAKGTRQWSEGVENDMLKEYADNTTLEGFLGQVKDIAPEYAAEIDNWITNTFQSKSTTISDAAREIQSLGEKIHRDERYKGIGSALDTIGENIWMRRMKGEYKIRDDIPGMTLSELNFNAELFPDDTYASDFLEELGYENPDYVTPEDEAAWNDINPRNFENVPTSPEVKQPRTVKYSDYAASYAEDPSIEQALKDAIKNEQFNKLNDIKEKNSDKYEKLLERLDRINAANNSDVKNSNVVQDAAIEYRKNVKSLEDSTILTEKFSYLAQLPTAKGSLKEFAESNNLQLPEGDGDLKSKVKEALWNMLQEGKDLPSIKGLKKTDYKLDPSKKDSYKNIDVDSLLKNPDNGLIVDKKEFFKLLGKTELFRNPAGPNSLKYELNKEDLYNDIDDAIDGMMELIKKNGRANSAIESMVEYTNGNPSETRFEFAVLCEVLSKNGLSTYKQSIEALSHKVVDGAISDRKAIVKGNLRSLYEQVETAIYDKLESRLAAAKNALEAAGETVESETITDILTRHAKEIGDAEADPFIVKTTNRDGEIQYERVSPAIAGIYNERGVYEPLGTGTKILANLALLKKINTTDLSPRSFMKQTFSDPAMAFATVGALPGSLQALRDEIEAQLGPDVFQALQKVDPARYRNIELIAEREGISLEEALARNLKAIANTEVPFTLLNEEILRQAKVSKYGLKAATKMNAKNTQDKINSALRKVSDKLGTPQNIRETYVRKLAGETAFLKALRKGYSLHQSEIFRVHAINTATTNFRTKHTMFNKFRSTVPYLTSGISGAKSFWQMFEMDPLGVTSRMFTGFVAPILYFMGEIMSDEEAKKKYESLAESEKDNHIFIKVGSQIIPIPVGEEVGQFSNIAVHLVETLFNENKYGFWSLMLNDLVNLIPGIDLTGFTDPDMWNAITGSPSFPDIIENGIAKVLAGATPPLAQSAFMAATGRDMYTGNRINTAYVDIDDDGNPVIMTSATSQFAKAVANVIGGDAKVIQKVVSGIGGTVLMDVLDTVTSAVQFVGSAGKEGSLTTGLEKFFGNASAPFAANGYDELDKRFSGSITQLWYKKDSIEHGDPNMNQYIKYNQEIAKEKDPERRQLLKNKRNDLLNDFYKEVETLVKNYRDAGGTLDKDKFSKVVSLLTFEDAVRADRQFMDLNTGYSDAYNQAMQTLYDMGIENPDGVSSLGYIYTDKKTGKPEIKMWNPVQMQIINDTIWDGGDIHRAQIEAIIDDGTKNSIKNLSKTEKAGEQPFWDKYNATGKLSDKEWDAIDDLREAFNAQVVIALADYMDAYGAANILSNDAVIDYLEDIIKVPSEYETVKGRNVSSGNGKLNKQQGFAESYIKKIFGVK